MYNIRFVYGYSSCRQPVKSTSSLIQSTLLFIAVSIFTIYGYGLSAVYGALVSLSNIWIFGWYFRKQKAAVDADAQTSFKMAIKSSVLRVFSLMVLVLLGLVVLGIEAQPLVVCLVLGQVGFILDRLRQK